MDKKFKHVSFSLDILGLTNQYATSNPKRICKATRNFLRQNGGKCGKKSFDDELDFKQIPVSVKREKKE